MLLESDFPEVEAVADELAAVRDSIALHNPADIADEEGNVCIDVRLQVYPDGGWYVRSGDPCYDTDHRGYWGSGCVAADDDLQEVAKDLISEAQEDCAQQDQLATSEQQKTEADGPQEDDWITEDYQTFRVIGGRDTIHVPDGEDWRTVLRQRMEEKQWFPNVWYQSDHGNTGLVSWED